jgi:hypothetical protein
MTGNTMAIRRPRKSKSLAAQTVELGVAVPQVLSFMHAAMGIFGKGMAPVRRRAVANAKRLGRVKRR